MTPSTAVRSPILPASPATRAAHWPAGSAGPADVVTLSSASEEKAAEDLMRSVERRGIWETWKVPEIMGTLRSGLRPGESLLEAVQAYEVLFDVEHRNTVDPTPKACQAYALVQERLRPGESRLQAARAYADLWLFERRFRDLDPTSWTLKDYALLDAEIPAGADRRQAIRLYSGDMEKFSAAMARERERVARRDAEVARMAEAVAAPAPAPAVVEEPGWILVGGVSLPVRGG